MKPPRSPWFQSFAERVSIASISRGGSPIGTPGAEHAASRIMTPGARRTICLFRSKEVPTYLPRWPSPDEVVHSLTRSLARLPAPPDSITFSGNGEPTLHPRFAVVVDRVLAVRAEVALKTRVAILSNGLSAGERAVRAALMRLDDRVMKLDPGPMERVNGISYDGERVVTAYRALAPYTVQAMVVRGRDWDGSSDESVAAWLPRL